MMETVLIASIVACCVAFFTLIYTLSNFQSMTRFYERAIKELGRRYQTFIEEMYGKDTNIHRYVIAPDHGWITEFINDMESTVAKAHSMLRSLEDVERRILEKEAEIVKSYKAKGMLE